MTHGLCNIKKIHGKGNHLILDGYVKEAKFLKKKIIIKNLLNNLVKETKMTKISRPLIVNYKAKNNDKTQDGITGTIILAESNITIHTYPTYNFFCLDIFSCQEFEIDQIVNFLKRELQITKYSKKILKRGFYGKN